jgi:hypothetical protein
MARRSHKRNANAAAGIQLPVLIGLAIFLVFFPLLLRTQGGAGNDYFSVISVFTLSCGEIRLTSADENEQLDSSRNKNLPVILSIGGWVRSLDSALRVLDCPGLNWQLFRCACAFFFSAS